MDNSHVRRVTKRFNLIVQVNAKWKLRIVRVKIGSEE